ncbi:MAG: hypothetical protein PHE21_03375 [Candidatus Dojkabacteria bacterium]|nr:hypothetical protein [Candidatus Dojkabacteria bacterium]
METIPAIYWMIVIGVIAAMICVVLLFLALFINDYRKGIHKAMNLMDDASRSLKQVEDILSNVQSTIQEVSNAILVPVRKIQSGISVAMSFIDGLIGRKRDSE